LVLDFARNDVVWTAIRLFFAKVALAEVDAWGRDPAGTAVLKFQHITDPYC
jgi:hypothetical protein